ncbi:hypothetical protein CEXT_385861 [Caerostris extrusa]|uniref:Uncharacterized protein n=1 Tax=Caerostris extrusa TaxID=172846 RepID=A0AAV4TUY0_CAEEX|nr:hypothetical protein CEXT_385861 [Caerostris extrusa]
MDETLVHSGVLPLQLSQLERRGGGELDTGIGSDKSRVFFPDDAADWMTLHRTVEEGTFTDVQLQLLGERFTRRGSEIRGEESSK